LGTDQPNEATASVSEMTASFEEAAASRTEKLKGSTAKISYNELAASVSEVTASLEKAPSSRPLGTDQPNGATAQIPDITAAAASFEMATASPSGTDQPNVATAQISDVELAKNIWEKASPITLHGGALRTWSQSTGFVERVQVLMKTEGRHLNANLELWHGPDNSPLKMAIYSEDGLLRPMNVVIETPIGQNTIGMRNTGLIEFPLTACVETDVQDVAKKLSDSGTLKTIQGGSMDTFPFDHSVPSVQVLLKTGGRPMNARVELLQGANDDKFVIDIYTEDGMEHALFAVIETPGDGNVVRIINTAPVEFPLIACVKPHLVEASGGESGGRCGWDNGGATTFLPRGRSV
jgi:hypothetical protein